MNKHFSVNLLRVVLGIWLAATSLSACAMSDTSRVVLELKRMKPERYFTDRVQADFVTAVGRGDLQRAQQLLAQGANVNAIGKEGMTPLFWVIGKQSLEGFRFLLSHGANPNLLVRWQDTKGREQSENTLRLAAMLENAAYLQAALDAGGNPNLIVNSTSQTPLYTAILHQRRANVVLLLQRGASIDHRDKSSTTPINYAVNARHYALALQLLRSKADPTIDDRWGYDAIDTTKQFGNRGVVIGSADEAAYTEFVAELKRLGLW